MSGTCGRTAPTTTASRRSRHRAKPGGRASAGLLLATIVLLAACDPGADKPYLDFAGGGFVFNYRLATADYGFVARVLRSLPEGSVVEAEFENPGAGAPIIMRQDTRPGRTSYVFRTPPLQGVRANRDYLVVLRLLDHSRVELARYEKRFRSDVDQSVLPESPPVVGPGYQRAPASQ